MSYVGNSPAEIYSSVQKQDLTGGSGTSFTLSYPASTNDVSVFVNNVRQEPGEAYTVSGTTLTMTGSITATDDFYVIFSGLTQGTISPPDGSVTTDKIAGSAVTTAKLASPVGIDTTSSTFKMTDLSTNAFYRTGTFTPYYSAQNATVNYVSDVFTTASYQRQLGYYVRIGDLVTVQLQIMMDFSAAAFQNGGTASGETIVQGLPFNIANKTLYYPMSTTVYYNVDNVMGWSSYNLIALGIYNTKYCAMYFPSAGGTVSPVQLQTWYYTLGGHQSYDSQMIFQMTYETDEA